MAYIIDSNSKEHIYLNAYHLFGRLAYSVNTVVNHSEVSRIHAAIEWTGRAWQILNYSKNGTWVNKQKLAKDRPHLIAKEDVINVGSIDENEFMIADLAPPQDILVGIDGSGQLQAEVITLNTYNLLPNSDNPECALFLEYSNATWCLEYLKDTPPPSRVLRDNDLISFADRRWQLKLNRGEAQTRKVKQDSCSLENIDFIFNLSMDEEYTTLSLKTPNGTINLDARIHHYLTLNLARHKAESVNSASDETEHGWVYTEQLAKDLGLTETYVNIQIHRARKQFANALNAQVNSEHFIQRRCGKVRLGAPSFKVYKGQKLECALPGNSSLPSNM